MARDKRVSYREVCQPNQRAGGDDGRCTGGKNADSIKKEDRVHLGIDEQAAYRWSSYRPISKSVQVPFFLVVPEAALETVGGPPGSRTFPPFKSLSSAWTQRGLCGPIFFSASELEGRRPVHDAPQQTKFGI